MKHMKSKTYTLCEKLICDGIDKKKYLIYYRILNFYVRHGMIVETVQEKLSFKQSRWFQPHVVFNTDKRAATKMTLIKSHLNL